MNPSVQNLCDKLQQRGYRLTRPRRSIMRALVESRGHISADELVDLVHETAPHVGRMTVYRTLDLLHELGLIRPVYLGSGAAHYVLMDDGHHHHLICSNCETVVEFEDCILKEIGETLGARFDFDVKGHLLELYGICAECRES
jgi:Fur family ferric uptake transcriptional regulator